MRKEIKIIFLRKRHFHFFYSKYLETVFYLVNKHGVSNFIEQKGNRQSMNQTTKTKSRGTGIWTIFQNCILRYYIFSYFNKAFLFQIVTLYS